MEKLPQNIQKEIKDVLKSYDKVNVVFEDGKYNVTTGTALKRSYSDDHKFIGTYYAKDVFNENESIANYIEEFISYPMEYKGKRDWSMIEQMNELRNEGKQCIISLDENGNAFISDVIEF